jgi:hypothetical protein
MDQKIELSFLSTSQVASLVKLVQMQEYAQVYVQVKK